MPNSQPAWVERLRSLHRAGTVQEVILHGNVQDFVPCNGTFGSLTERISRECDGKKACVVFYDRATGFSFPHEDAERYFRDLVGLPLAPKPGTPEYAQWEEQMAERRQVLAALGEDTRAVLEEPVTLPLPRDPGDALPCINAAFDAQPEDKGKPRKALVIVFEYAESLVPAALHADAKDEDRWSFVTFQKWANEPRYGRHGNLLILITAHLENIHAGVREATVEAIEISLPDYDERIAFIRYALRESRVETRLTREQFALLTAGLSRRHILNLCREAKSDHVVLSADTIKAAKKALIEAQTQGILEVIEPRFGLEALGGLEHLKEFGREIIQAMLRGDAIMVPQGLLLMGPPGTGKSAYVEALAYEASMNFVRFGSVLSMWHGESERQYRSGLTIIRALAPCVVIEDDADQGENRRGEWQGDTGVSNRIRQMRFNFTADPGLRGKVLWVRITNHPELLDAADKRSGRSSERIVVPMPDAREKAQIFSVMPQKLKFRTAVQDFTPLVAALDARHGQCISGADIEEISRRAYQHARRRGACESAREDYAWAIDDFIPLHNLKEIQAMERQAINECSSNRFLPPQYRRKTDGAAAAACDV